MRKMTVIGGGMAGLACAALAQARGYEVTVIEAGPDVGSLWKSTSVDLAGHRLFLDAGLRLPVATGEARLDGALFHRSDFVFDWTHIDGWPREGAITANSFNPESSCLNAAVLGNDIDAVIAEMRSVEGASGGPSALDYARAAYGSILAGGLIADAVAGILGMDLAELDPKAVTWFVPRRVVLGDADQTTTLLADTNLSGRVAHARHADLPQGGSRMFLRPQEGGISTWVRALYASLKRAGVRFILKDGLQDIERDRRTGAIRRLVLRSGRTVDAEQLVCTVAPSVIARALEMEPGVPPPFRDLHITHMLVDRAPMHQANYSLNFRRDAAFFRAIFHDNLGDAPGGAHVLTFEHIAADGPAGNFGAAALAQCVATGAMPDGCRMIAAHSDRYRNAVAVQTVAHGRATDALRRALSAIPGLHFAGRSAGGAPFLDQIIHEADQVIGAMAQEPSP